MWVFSTLGTFAKIIPNIQSIGRKISVQRFVKKMETDESQHQIQDFAKEEGVVVPQVLTFDLFKQLSIGFNVFSEIQNGLFSNFQDVLKDYLRFVMLCYHSSFRVDFRWIKRAHQIGFHGCPQKSGNFEKQGSDNQIHWHVMVWAWFYPCHVFILILSPLQRILYLFEFLR